MKNEYGVIDPKAVKNALIIEKFNNYVIQTIRKGKQGFYIYGTNDRELCRTLLHFKTNLELNRKFIDYNLDFQEDEYGEIDHIHVSW